MSKKIIGVTVGTPISPSKLQQKLNPVKTVNGQSPDANGNVKVDTAEGMTLGVHTDGLIYLFKNGAPQGVGLEIKAEEVEGGDVVGYIDENNNIVVKGNLADGTYSVKYEMEDGSFVSIGSLVLDSNVYYTVSKTLTKCTINNSTTEVAQGGSYSATISANSGYNLSSIKVTMGGTDITASVVSGGSINITNVTGNIVITASATEAAVYYTVTKNLTNCSISNSATSVLKGGSFAATITANSGYELSSVTVTMGGSPITVTNGVINISNVTGDIVITASAKAEAPNLIVTSVNTDGTPFGTNGIVEGKRWGSSGTLSNGQANTTGLIACKAGDIVLLEKCGLYQGKLNEAHRVTFWNTSRGILGYEQPFYLKGTYMTNVQFANDFVTQFTVAQDGFFAVSGINKNSAETASLTDYLDANSKITIKSAS